MAIRPCNDKSESQYIKSQSLFQLVIALPYIQLLISAYLLLRFRYRHGSIVYSWYVYERSDNERVLYIKPGGLLQSGMTKCKVLFSDDYMPKKLAEIPNLWNNTITYN